MNEEKQKIIIAEEVGFEEISEVAGLLVGIAQGAPNRQPLVLPDYHHDLNAMKSAIQSLPDNDRISFFRILETVVDRDAGKVIAFAVGESTATQQAEAFLRLKGKWEG